MKWPVIDHIWRSRGKLELEADVTRDEALERLSVLFDPDELQIDRANGTLGYRKPNPAAQDRLATFSNGVLHLEENGRAKALRYDVGSPALLLTFLAPLLFLALAQATVGLGQWEESKATEEEKANDEDDDKPGELHWIDTMLGAPAPEEPDKDEEEEEDNEDYSPETAYGLAALFALIYLVGRFLEPRLFRKTLRNAIANGPSGPRLQEGMPGTS